MAHIGTSGGFGVHRFWAAAIHADGMSCHWSSCLVAPKFPSLTADLRGSGRASNLFWYSSVLVRNGLSFRPAGMNVRDNGSSFMPSISTGSGPPTSLSLPRSSVTYQRSSPDLGGFGYAGSTQGPKKSKNH